MATNHCELAVWEKAMMLTESVKSVVQVLPPIERFGLSGPLRRAAISVPSNIAEGHQRRSRADYRRFIAKACGSLAELETQLELTQRLHHVDDDLLSRSPTLADETERLLGCIERAQRTPAIADDLATYDLDQRTVLSPQPSALE
ncbi:MAG TPA: four helix bundle protein [Rudaea sp.]|nr:four helix bundle protein [Rudaea sp.]